MLPIAYYLLKVIICSGILYGYYWLSLRNKVFHKYNRFYLMASVLLSILLPLIKIDFWQHQAQQQSSMIRVLQAVSNGDEYMDNIIVTTGSNGFDMEQLYPLAYMLVSVILLVVFMHTLFVIFSLLRKYPKQTIDKVSFINTDAKSTPFSFLNYIFWNYNIDVETTTGNQIFKHELAHVQEGHTYDKLFINIVLIFFWCNPFYWLYRKELNMIHEFIADKKAVEDNDTEAFAAMILQATYPQHRFQLTNNFFYSPIKRRLLMLTKNKNPKVNYFGRIMVLPLLVIIFAAFTLKAKPMNHYYHGKKLTVVIDAGHGGKDAGTKSADGNTLEKDVTLNLAKAIKELNSNNDIEIILTKETDIYLSKEQKAAFAKSHNAAMYISLHAGATTSETEYNLGDGMNEKSGLKLLIGNGESPNSIQSLIFGSAILNEFTGNYELPVAQELVKRPLYTLEHNTCPSVYIEAGLINNKKDLAYLQSAKGKEDIAKNILTAIEKFASTNLQTPVAVADVFHFAQPNHSMFINTNYADTTYFKTAAYKTKALVIVDSREIGNVGMDYVEKSNVEYSSLVTYNPAEAQKKYGGKGKYGVIKLTIKEVQCMTADSIFYDDKKQTIKLSGNNSSISGDLEKTIIYVDGKKITPLQLNEIKPETISSVNILKGEKLDEIAQEKGKTSIINVTLKPADLAEVRVTAKKTDPLYVIDNKIQVAGFELKDIEISPNNIERVDVLKDNAAITKYGEQARNGVVEITTKNNILKFKNPILSIGNLTGHTVTVEDLKKQTQLNVSDGYSFVSATAYCSGKNFPQVAIVTLNGNSLEPLKGYMEKAVDGSAIIFDNIRVKKDGIGMITIDGHAFNIVDGKRLRNLTTDQPWAAAAAGQKTPSNGLTEVTVSGYAMKKYPDTLAGIQTDRIFTKVENEPYYPGGSEAWKKYLTKNIDPTIPAKEGWKAGIYTVIVQFIVHADGTVSDVTTTNYQGSKTAQHCIDLIKKSANWSPAIQNGRTVNAYRKQPITFLIEAGKRDITAIYSVPFKVHLMTEGKMNTYQLVGNGKFTAEFKSLFYVNGKLTTSPENIKPGVISSIESYDEGAGKLHFEEKGKSGATWGTSKS